MNKENVINNMSFCMNPWTHINTTPSGDAQPCCISDPLFKIGNSKTNSLMELVNSDQMNKLRVDMLSGKKSTACSVCYKHEETGYDSFRLQVNRNYSNFYDELIPLTNTDGSLQEFKMKYFDIRFNNICNMKCRTCNDTFSSQWEMENKRVNINSSNEPKRNNKKFLQEVLDQIPNIQTAYFAGGEPLITEEHYIMLEEIIRQGHTGITLRYNTNLSNLTYKDKDLISLWSNFTNKIVINASIDHFGKKAEYIRKGTVWADIEENYKKLQQMPNVLLGINTVLSIYNFLTIDEFYQYLFDQGMSKPTSPLKPTNPNSLNNGIYKMSDPSYLSPLILPTKYKKQGIERISKLAEKMLAMEFTQGAVREVSSIIPWIDSEDQWDLHKDMFRQETARVDQLRGENFSEIFPELAELLG